MRYTAILPTLTLLATLAGCSGEKGTLTDTQDIEQFEQQVVDEEQAHRQQLKEEAKAARKR